MKVIYKYPVVLTNEIQAIQMPIGEILCVQLQDDFPKIWVKVSRVGAPSSLRRFKIIETGEEFDNYANVYSYIGTFQLGSIVLHLFEIT